MLARFLTKNEFSYCTDCYQRIFTKNWRQSETVIQTGTGETEEEEEEAGPASGEVMRLGRSDSLQCGHCHSGLWGQSFSWREGQPYCLPCINRLFCKPCQGCPEPIRNDNHQCWSLTMTDLPCFRLRRWEVRLAGRPLLAHLLLPLHSLLSQLGGRWLYSRG